MLAAAVGGAVGAAEAGAGAVGAGAEVVGEAGAGAVGADDGAEAPRGVVSPVAAVKTSRTPCWNMAMLTMTHVAKIATMTANSTLAAPDSWGRRSTPHRTSEVDLTHS